MERCVESVSDGLDITLGISAGMREDAKRKIMRALISLAIWLGRSSEQAQGYPVPLYSISIFAIIDERDPIAKFADIRKFVSCTLEFVGFP